MADVVGLERTDYLQRHEREANFLLRDSTCMGEYLHWLGSTLHARVDCPSELYESATDGAKRRQCEHGKVKPIAANHLCRSPVDLLHSFDLTCSQVCYDGREVYGMHAFWWSFLGGPYSRPVLLPAGVQTVSERYLRRLYDYFAELEYDIVILRPKGARLSPVRALALQFRSAYATAKALGAHLRPMDVQRIFARTRRCTATAKESASRPGI